MDEDFPRMNEEVDNEVIDLVGGNEKEMFSTNNIIIGLLILLVIFIIFRNNFSDSSLIAPPLMESKRPYTSGSYNRFGATDSATDRGEYTSGFDFVQN